jgi:type I restriction enzyme M protein
MTTAQRSAALLKSARDIMRKDKGLNGDLDRLPMLTWIMFLKFLDDMEQREDEAKLAGKKFKPAIEAPYRWRDWAARTGRHHRRRADCVHQPGGSDVRPDGSKGPGLFAYLRSLQARTGTNRRDVIATVFKGVVNRMINGYLLRDVVNKIDGIHFTSSDELHTLGASTNPCSARCATPPATPASSTRRAPVVRFMVDVTDPRLGETVLDPACGTGGFLVEAFSTSQKQVKTVADRKLLQTRSLFGSEPKSAAVPALPDEPAAARARYPQIDPGNALAIQGHRDRRQGPRRRDPHQPAIRRRGRARHPGQLPRRQADAETALLFLQLIMRKLAAEKPKACPAAPPSSCPTARSSATASAPASRKNCSRSSTCTPSSACPTASSRPTRSIPTNVCCSSTAPARPRTIWYYEQPLARGPEELHQDAAHAVRGVRDCIKWFQRIVTKIVHLSAKIDDAAATRVAARRESEVLVRSRLRAIGEVLGQAATLQEVLTEKPRNGWSAVCDNAAGGVPVLTLSAITGYNFDPTAIKHTSLATDPDAHYWLRSGDLLITRSNTPTLVGHAAVYSGEPSPCIFPDLMMRIPVDPEKADTRFIWYWLQAPQVRGFIERNAKGTSPTMKKISQGTVMAIPFPRVPLQEQQRIVAELDGLQTKVDRLKGLQQKTAAELDALLPSILDKAFKGEL